MSYQIGIDAIHVRPSERLAHTEYCTNDDLMKAVAAETGMAFEDAWDFDFIWNVNDGQTEWKERGRVTDMGHAEFLAGGSDRREAKTCPFESMSDVLTFDAVAEYGLPDFDELVAYYEKEYQEGQKAHPNQVFTGGYYKTIVSGAIEAFGWEMLLMAAIDPDGFERVLDSIFRLSLHHYKAWAETSAEVFISHDDMVWTEGPFMDPAFYRRVIFPRYKELWSVLKQAGKKVLYCSDGDYTMFVDDIVEGGVDGLIFEPMTQIEPVVQKYGKTHCLVTSKVDCRTLTFETEDQIRAEIDATLELAAECPGFIFAVGNHIPSNVPLENGAFYFEYLREHWGR